MSTQTIQGTTFSFQLIGHWEQVSEKFATLAAAIPEDKFDFKPTGGTRTVADVLRHVAFWNRFVADNARGNKADDTTNEVSKEKFAARSQILSELRRSAKDATEALRNSKSGMALETSEMLTTFIEHTSEHYGQLAVYARLNGIVPPASRA
ncbi:MAG TPA: DinB family protein [Terracidiphilus sp.]|nr:DinB family protein [Terracidiphilus sp.]